jgi:hypothetical protein
MSVAAPWLSVLISPCIGAAHNCGTNIPGLFTQTNADDLHLIETVVPHPAWKNSNRSIAPQSPLSRQSTRTTDTGFSIAPRIIFDDINY